MNRLIFIAKDLGEIEGYYSLLVKSRSVTCVTQPFSFRVSDDRCHC